MSLEKMVDVLYRSKASPRAKLVLLGIANHQGDMGAYPAIATLARYANCSERSVKRDIQELVDLGELKREKNASPMGSRYKTNLYWVIVQGVTGETPLESLGVTAQVTRGDSSGNLGVTALAHEPSIKPIKEPVNLLPKNKSATGVSEDFKPSSKAWDEMAEHFPHVDLKLETHSFRDYWLSKTGKDSQKKDWDATWRNWIRNAHKRMMTSPAWQRAMKEAEREKEIAKLYENSGD